MSLSEHGKIDGILYIITRIINKAEITGIPVKQFMYKNKSSLLLISQFRPNKKISVLRVTGLKILGRVGTHIFLINFFSGKKIIILCIFKGILPFKMHKIIFFQENLKKILGFTSK